MDETLTAEHWYTNGTVIGVTGVAAGIVAILVAVLLWRFGTPQGLLEYSMPVSKALVSRSPNIRNPDLQVTLRGKVVQNPYLVTVRIANYGHRDIRSDDFDQKQPLIFHLDAEVLEVLSSSNSDKQLFDYADGAKLSLSPALIRRGQEITVDVLTEGKPKLSCVGELADVKLRAPSNSASAPISGILAGLAVISILLIGIFSPFINDIGRLVVFIVSALGAIGVIWTHYGLIWNAFHPHRRRFPRKPDS